MAISVHKTCPRCGSSDIRRSHRHGGFVALMLSIFELIPYRCDACYHRFYARSSIAMRRASKRAAAS
jgi:transposase-like protein